jgi:hypothetical protein
MRFATVLTLKRVGIVSSCAGVLATIACADGRQTPTSPSANGVVSTLTAPGEVRTGGPITGAALAASPRSGVLHVEKGCPAPGYTGQAGDFCTVVASNIKGLEVGATITYASAMAGTSLDSDVVITMPGPGNNKIYGHCQLEVLTVLGECTFSGGSGKFTHFQGQAGVSFLSGTTWAWDGTYSFSPRD